MTADITSAATNESARLAEVDAAVDRLLERCPMPPLTEAQIALIVDVFVTALSGGATMPRAPDPTRRRRSLVGSDADCTPVVVTVSADDADRGTRGRKGAGTIPVTEGLS